MYISKTEFSKPLTRRFYEYKTQNVSFGYRMPLVRPTIENESGKHVLNKVLKLVEIVPDKGKISRPFLVMVNDQSYGILVDKTTPTLIRIVVKNMTENKNWEEIINERDVFSGEFDSQLGKMLSGDYNGMHFYRNQNKRMRKIKTKEARFAPVTYSSDDWGLTTYGEKNTVVDKSKKNDSVLGSIFWAMSGINASILGNK